MTITLKSVFLAILMGVIIFLVGIIIYMVICACLPLVQQDIANPPSASETWSALYPFTFIIVIFIGMITAMYYIRPMSAA